MPLRRDASLIPLSHDHHHGLVRVFEIRQALKARTGLAAEAAATREFYRGDLAPHFEAEETVVFPAMRATDCGLELIDVLLDEHRRLRQMASGLEATPEPMSAFADLLERHIRREERELFAQYQEHVPEAQRAAIEAEVRRILHRPNDDAAACDLSRRS